MLGSLHNVDFVGVAAKKGEGVERGGEEVIGEEFGGELVAVGCKRKVLDKRVGEDNGGKDLVMVVKAIGNGWSSSEDIALLNAMKVFPKDISMRWEKVVATVS
ncbi:hypothetical protein VNO80_10175 [Phaseolus coccineus]|uniref:Myb-like domain-containing protein n=1 Tax=Phaseolus coccineus TaxID=3886 RepID=A0AAN9NCY3_PHACN